MSTITRPKSVITKKTSLAPNERTVEAPTGSLSDDPVTTERIRTRAYDLYLQRSGNGGAGDAASDWLQAERELNGSAREPRTSRDIESRSQARGDTLLASGE